MTVKRVYVPREGGGGSEETDKTRNRNSETTVYSCIHIEKTLQCGKTVAKSRKPHASKEHHKGLCLYIHYSAQAGIRLVAHTQSAKFAMPLE
jgi:hypothetical protein